MTEEEIDYKSLYKRAVTQNQQLKKLVYVLSQPETRDALKAFNCYDDYLFEMWDKELNDNDTRRRISDSASSVESIENVPFSVD